MNHEQITYQCPNCGQVDSHTDECPSNPQRYEHDTSAAPGRADDGVNRYLKSEIEHLLKENSTLIAQREGLRLALAGLSRRHPYCWCGTWVGGEHEAECLAAQEAMEVITTSEQEGRTER